MPVELKKQFPHRRNLNGTFDSICPRCFHTVATRSTEIELRRDEHRHVCDDWNLDVDKLIQSQNRFRLNDSLPSKSSIPILKSGG